jgi:hypothetical protein
MLRYQPSDFPIKDPVEAKIVVSQMFDIRDYPDLIVDLNEVRSNEYWEDALQTLGVANDKLPEKPPPHYMPILFFGHRGSGKTVELWRLKNHLHRPGLFDVVLMDSDSEFNYGQFRWEDFFLLMLNAMYRKADAADKKLFSGLREMARSWLGNTEIKAEISKALTGNGSPGSQDENWLLESIGNREVFKKFYSENTFTARQIRTTINSNPPAVAAAIAEMVGLLRKKSQAQGFRDVLFIFDGTEKVDFSQYETLFINNVAAMQGLGTHLVCGVPIAARYKLQGSVTRDLYHQVMLPMYHLKDDAHYPLFGRIITERIDKNTLLDEDALRYIVLKSGGSPRQLLQIFEKAFFRTRGAKVSLDFAQKAVKELGTRLWENLYPGQIDILRRVKNGDNRWEKTDPNLDLVDELVLMKYNGSVAVNPLLDDFLP